MFLYATAPSRYLVPPIHDRRFKMIVLDTMEPRPTATQFMRPPRYFKGQLILAQTKAR